VVTVKKTQGDAEERDSSDGSSGSTTGCPKISRQGSPK